MQTQTVSSVAVTVPKQPDAADDLPDGICRLTRRTRPGPEACRAPAGGGRPGPGVHHECRRDAGATEAADLAGSRTRESPGPRGPGTAVAPDPAEIPRPPVRPLTWGWASARLWVRPLTWGGPRHGGLGPGPR